MEEETKWRRTKWTRHVPYISSSRRILIEKTEGEKSLWIPRSRWENNIEMDINVGVRTGFSWLKIGSNDGLLCVWQWTLGLNKRWAFFGRLSEYQITKNNSALWSQPRNWKLIIYLQLFPGLPWYAKFCRTVFSTLKRPVCMGKWGVDY